jgi:hypothetical protein
MAEHRILSSPTWENNFVRIFEAVWRDRKSPDFPGRQLLDLIALIPILITISNEELPEQVKQILVTLAKYGWFLTGEFHPSDLLHWKSLIDAGDSASIDTYFCGYTRKRLQYSVTKLIRQFPRRKTIFRAAFRAHKRKEFALSVPVFLIQADGMCYDKLGFLLFQKDRAIRGQPIMADHVRKLNLPDWEQALIEALMIELPLNTKVDSLSSDDQRFNRHAILHGMVCNYDTEEVSLKSISLLACLGDILPRLDSKRKV